MYSWNTNNSIGLLCGFDFFPGAALEISLKKGYCLGQFEFVSKLQFKRH
jgi:hypothetical protein